MGQGCFLENHTAPSYVIKEKPYYFITFFSDPVSKNTSKLRILDSEVAIGRVKTL
jgi:hypothetical protein